MTASPVSLDSLSRGQSAQIVSVDSVSDGDQITQRLGELGFVVGETLLVEAIGPLGRSPVLVGIGSTRFALRSNEASRIKVTVLEEARA